MNILVVVLCGFTKNAFCTCAVSGRIVFDIASVAFALLIQLWFVTQYV